jgi:serine/threonine-protein kinase HipA
MATARLLGVNAAKTEYRVFDGELAVVVERYDRRVDESGTVVREHQEDMCQALSVLARYKYEDEGGPGAAQIADLLRDIAAQDDVWRFIEALAFNYLIEAPDGHAKNFSMLLPQNGIYP